jgi:hypothetical protein
LDGLLRLSSQPTQSRLLLSLLAYNLNTLLRSERESSQGASRIDELEVIFECLVGQVGDLPLRGWN